jgi:hypothetical protein
MRKNTRRLSLSRETLHRLEALRHVRAAAPGLLHRIDDNPSYQSGETYCWCTDTCNCSGDCPAAIR